MSFQSIFPPFMNNSAVPMDFHYEDSELEQGRKRYEDQIINSIVQLIIQDKRIASDLIREVQGNLDALPACQFKALQRTATSVHSLNLSGIPLTAQKIQQLQKLFPQLRILNVRNTQLTCRCMQELRKFTKLEVLNIKDNHFLSNTVLIPLVALKELRKLSLSGCEPFGTLVKENAFTDDMLGSVLSRLTKLQSLIISDARQLKNNSLEALQKLPELRQVQLLNCPSITDEGVTDLAESESIRKLKIRFCPLVSERILTIIAKENRIRVVI